MRKRVAIDFCCNDPRDGSFAGRAVGASWGECELEPPDWEHGFKFTEGNGWIQIHRRRFLLTASKDWFGNWCWNRYVLPRSEAKKLLGAMRKAGWRCTQGPCRLYDWWNGRDETS